MAQAQASYDATAASYRQTVLTAFQQVEDNLAALRVLADEVCRPGPGREIGRTLRGGFHRAIQRRNRQLPASDHGADHRACRIERSAIDVQTRRMAASVLLIEALGGGWDASQLPTAQDVARK